MSQTPLGERVPSAIFEVRRAYGPNGWSQTPLGERVPSAKTNACFSSWTTSGLKPLSGNVCLRPNVTVWAASNRVQSQTPLGERVPSAGIARELPLETLARSQTPLGERVPSAVGNRRRDTLRILRSQTPLGERVPSAMANILRDELESGGLKPLSGNVCLRPGSWATRYSANIASQTPLGERVPSAEIWGVQDTLRGQGLKPLSGNVCLRPPLLVVFQTGSDNVSNPSRGTCAFGLWERFDDDE